MKTMNEMRHIPTQSRTVEPDGQPAYREYFVPGHGWMRWRAFLELNEKLAADIRDNDETQRRPADIQ